MARGAHTTRTTKKLSLYRPLSGFIGGLLLLIILVGLLFAGIIEAHLAGDQGWVFFFTAGLISAVIVYFRVVADMIGWLEGYHPVDEDLHCEHDYCCEDDKK